MKKFNKLISDLKSTPRGKSVLFFSFYFIFFVALAIGARLVTPGEPIGKKIYENELNNSNNIDIKQINGDNYQYKYKIQIDNAEALIEGKKDGYLELFNINNLESITNYYKNNSLYYSYENGTWIPGNIPNNNLEIINNIDKILLKGTYIAKTEYESGKRVFRYEISSATLGEIVDNINLDIADIPNQIIVTSNDQKHVDNIQINLDSYCKVTSKCVNNMSLQLDFLDFDKQKVESPIIK